MKSFIYTLLAWSLFLNVSSAAPALSQTPAAPLPPSQDPFYTAPANYELAAPGTVLRIRAAPGDLKTAVGGNSSFAYNILYRTTDSLYKPSWAVTTLFLPLSNTTSSTSQGKPVGKALLSYQIPYDSADLDASPSYALYTPGFPDISAALGKGWSVSVPDYEGPLASFGLGVQAGHATLDSVRAVLSLKFGCTSDTPYAMWGYSGGSIASEFAAELQVQYAPELNFSGVAIGGLVVNGTSDISLISGSEFAVDAIAVLLGIVTQYPEAEKFLLSKLKTTGPYDRTTFLSVKNMTFEQGLPIFAKQNIFNYFINGEADLLAPIMQKIYNSNLIMGYHGVPQMPLYVYKAIADQLSLVEETDTLVDRYCAVGANILYQRNTLGAHFDEYFNGDIPAFEWLSSILDGSWSQRYPSEGCTIQNVTVGTSNLGY